MKNIFNSKILILSFLIINFLVLIVAPIKAEDGDSTSPICIPSQCNQSGQYVPDFNCINKQFLDPSAKNPGSDEFCCENKCKDPALNNPEGRPEVYNALFKFFGYTLAVTSEQQIPSLINLAVTTFLGFVSLYALIRGVYLGGYVRARSTDAGEIEQLNKQFVTLIAGFLLAWGFIVIMQVVANLLGLGSLSNIELIGEGGTQVIIN